MSGRKGGSNYNCGGFWRKGVSREDFLANEGFDKAMSGTFNAQTNVDVRVFGTVDLFLRSKGQYARGTSELLKICLGIIYDHALAEGTEPFIEVLPCIEYLEEMGYRLNQFETYKRRRITTALKAEALREARKDGSISLSNQMVGRVSHNPVVHNSSQKLPEIPEDDAYDEWGRGRYEELRKEMPDEEALEKAREEMAEKRSSTEDSVFIEIWTAYYEDRGRTHDGAREKAILELNKKKGIYVASPAISGDNIVAQNADARERAQAEKETLDRQMRELAEKKKGEKNDNYEEHKEESTEEEE
jgi:hypothetical protein